MKVKYVGFGLLLIFIFTIFLAFNASADVYEVTDLVNKILIEAALSGEELQYSEFGEIYRDLNSGGGLCPGHFDEVYDDVKLWEQYNERFSEYL